MEINFAERLNRAREMRGLSQADLAVACGKSQATIHRYLKGKNKSPQIDILVMMAKALNVSTDYLLGMTDMPNSKSDLSKEEYILLSAFSKAGDRDTGLIWSILDDYLTPAQKGFLPQSEATEEKLDA